MIAVDLDRFKDVNDTLGHTAGDSLLRTLAARLTGCVREEDLRRAHRRRRVRGRLHPHRQRSRDREVAQRLVDAVHQPFEIDGHEVFLTASVGIAVSEHGRETPEQLLRDADAAMYRAKELGGGRFEAFDISLRHRLVDG